MNSSKYGESQMFEAFIRSAQYFVRLKAQQDIWDHLGRFITTYFPVEWVAFVQRDPANEVSINYCTLPDKTTVQSILTAEVRALIADVLDSGFLVSQVIPTPAPSMTVFLPIVEAYQTVYVMLIGHKTADPLPNEQLNVYLAIASLVGTTLERLRNERELTRYRMHLEELVKELRESEEKFRLVADFTFDWETWTDPAVNYLYVSPSCERMTGHSAEEFYRDPELLSRIVHPDDLAAFRHHMDLYAKNLSESSGIDFRIVTAGGETRWISHLCQPVFGDKGEWLGRRANNRDITERKQAEEALKVAKAQAELYVDLMGHDINNMNQISLGFLELAHNIIEMEGKLGDDNIVLLDKAMDSLNNSSQLIDNVRKLQREKMGLYKPEVLDVDGVIEDAAKHFHSIPGRDVKITCTTQKHCRVSANGLLKDVFINLIGNAVKHSKGALTVNIQVNQVMDNGKKYCRVDVEDDGMGIPDTLKNTLFDRLNLSTTRARGKGFGLCLTKMLVDDYHGKFWVEDRVKGDYTKGARFVVMLPALV